MIDPTIIASVIRIIADIYIAKSKKGKQPKQTHKIEKALGDFSTRNKSFCTELKVVESVIKRYVARKTHKRPLNILLSASPGGGKSFLANQIAKTTGGKKADFQEVYIPTLSVATDLDGKFGEISKIIKKGSIPFVFFDEMDVEIDGYPLYGNFLGPIWDGKVEVGGIDANLMPAVFLFAGSAAFPALSKQGIQNLARFELQPVSYEAYRNNWIRELEQRIDGDDAPKKLKDFVDRMDIFVCIPPTDPVLMPDEEEVAMELMDIVYFIVRKYFKNINTIELAAMTCLIQELTYHTSRRVIESILQCARCKENSKEFLFVHLSETVCNRYGNNPKVLAGKGIMIPFV